MMRYYETIVPIMVERPSGVVVTIGAGFRFSTEDGPVNDRGTMIVPVGIGVYGTLTVPVFAAEYVCLLPWEVPA